MHSFCLTICCCHTKGARRRSLAHQADIIAAVWNEPVWALDGHGYLGPRQRSDRLSSCADPHQLLDRHDTRRFIPRRSSRCTGAEYRCAAFGARVLTHLCHCRYSNEPALGPHVHFDSAYFRQRTAHVDDSTVFVLFGAEILTLQDELRADGDFLRTSRAAGTAPPCTKPGQASCLASSPAPSSEDGPVERPAVPNSSNLAPARAPVAAPGSVAPVAGIKGIPKHALSALVPRRKAPRGLLGSVGEVRVDAPHEHARKASDVG